MKKIFIILFLLLPIFVYGCSSPKGNDVCLAACIEQGFTEGSCETLGVMPNPCETNLNKTTIYSQDGYCEELGINGQKVLGRGNMCCCN